MSNLTPYDSMTTMITDTVANGGAWYAPPGESVTSHQTVGGQSDFFLLNGTMDMWVDMPDDMWVDGTNMTYTWSLAACLDGALCLGTTPNPDIRTGGLKDMGTVTYTIPSCPTISQDWVHNGVITVGGSAGWTNGFPIWIQTIPVGGVYCTAYVGRLSFVVNPPNSSSSTGGAASTSAGSSGVTGSTASTALTASGTSMASTNSTGTTTATNLPSMTTKDGQSPTAGSGSGTGSTPLSQSVSPSINGNRNETKASPAVIAGGIVGGLVFLMVFAFAVWWIKMKKTRYDEKNRAAVIQPPFTIVAGANVGVVVAGGVAGEDRGAEMEERPGWQSKRALFLEASSSDRFNDEDLIRRRQRQLAEAIPRASGSGDTTSPDVAGLGVLAVRAPRRGVGNGNMNEGGNGDEDEDEGEALMSDTGESLPMYQSEYNGHRQHPSQSTPSVPLSNTNTDGRVESNSDNGLDAVGIWARANRYLISPDLERRLRSAGYIPDHDPSRISEEVWRERYGVSPFEVDTLKQLYAARLQFQIANANGNGDV